MPERGKSRFATVSSTYIRRGEGNGKLASKESAIAAGRLAEASGTFATAIGSLSIASGASSSAFGADALASGDGSVAVGAGAKSTGTNSIAIGAGASATGSIAIGAAASAGNGGAAFGDNTVATGTNAGAFGPGASATFANSTAIGAGATTTKANQVVVGTATNTYTMPGINSAASLASQVGPTKVVTTDANGNLGTANFNPQDVTGLQTNVAVLQGNVAALQSQMRQAFEGTAMAIAMGGSALPGDKKFAISTNWGTFRGENAAAVLAQARVTDNIVLNAGVAMGFAHSGIGGRAGVTFAW